MLLSVHVHGEEKESFGNKHVQLILAPDLV